MSIAFTATLKQTGKAIKIDRELECEITFTVPKSEIAELIKIVQLADQTFTVNIIPDTPAL